MTAYLNDAGCKAALLSRVRQHREAGTLRQGTGWDGNCGCAIGCMVEAYNHQFLETVYGIPKQIAHLVDAIFEGLGPDDCMAWPEQFLEAIEPGADLCCVQFKLLDWLIVESGLLQYGGREDLKAVAVRVALLVCFGRPIDKQAARAAASAADGAAGRAWRATFAGLGPRSVPTAASYYAAVSISNAARAAAFGAATGAAAAASYAAVSFATSPGATVAGEYAAKRAAFSAIGGRLLQLLRAAGTA